jgi:hypothetical protein
MDKEPEDQGKRQADRSDVRQEFARKRARTGFEPFGIADGRQPFMPRVSLEPLPFDASLPFCPSEADAAAFRRARETPFIQRILILAGFRFSVKNLHEKSFSEIAAPRFSRPAVTAPLARPYRL